MKILLDTNIIVDNLARRDEYGESLQILEQCENGRLEGVVTTVTIMDVLYILRKHLGKFDVRRSVQILFASVCLNGNMNTPAFILPRNLMRATLV